MKKRIFVLLLVLVFAAAGIYHFLGSRHAPIEEWSGNLTASGIEWAQIAVGYGNDKIGRNLDEAEYDGLLSLLSQITEDLCHRDQAYASNRNDHRLSLGYGGKLWLFHCLDNEMLKLTFHDEETSTYFGCADVPLYIDHPELWQYIMDNTAK